MSDTRGTPERGSGAPESSSQRVPRQSGSGHSLRRALSLTTLSAILPGSGLLGTPRRRLGLVVLALAVLALLVVGGYALTNGLTTTALQTAADTGRLRAIAVLLVLGTLVWVGAIALTALASAPRRATSGGRAALITLTAVLCLAVTAPAVFGVRYIDAHVDAVDKVFSSSGTVGGGGGGSTPTSVVGDDPDDPWKDQPRVNVLLLGSDAADAREGTRTDTMIVASIDTTTGDSVLFSIPRNLQAIPIPRDNPLHEVYGPVYDCGDQCLMNSIWTEAELTAEEHPDWYADDPTPGQTATREVLSGILGIPIHHTVIVNMEGFADLVDAMGGVLVNVQEPIPIGGRTFTDANGKLQLDESSDYTWLEAGSQRLDGPDALAYSRSRVTSDDFSRMRRQRCMVAAVVDQVNPMTMVQRYPQIIGAVGDNVVTDIPQEDLDEWAALVLKVQGATMSSLPFTGANIDTVDPNYSQIRARVYDAIHPQPAPEPPAEDEATATSAPEDAEETTEAPQEDDAAATSEEPSDDLEDVGAVCN
ncbi:Cell envelope-related transcriptional attenuator [Serinicoccus hydrothermalis]|uniref:Cell envelope-related transcriptional attenuator n=1 Tax=Serinicoccus hydrothermalis TaxID=1758689 RepID=A0A1B1NEN8_9MICO|nr:LCP family protein [Serinicoccus hydrothermalis]ANS79889.1 Cell envelope-related transcriptional attenuator [Serinicoccus hydrothermalis]